jgi:hypothetical protein
MHTLQQQWTAQRLLRPVPHAQALVTTGAAGAARSQYSLFSRNREETCQADFGVYAVHQ